MSDTPSKSRVAFQGERGAFSEQAAVALLGERIQVVPRPTFEALYASIADGLADYALAPIENSLAGSVHRSYDLLLESSLTIVDEAILPIHHHLIGCPGARLESVHVVESHPVALAQCERFFSERPLIKRVASDDTAGSVRQVIESGDLSRAAIAGRHAAEFYGGAILLENLEDHAENYTRFVLLAGEPEIRQNADKISLVMRLPHRPGALLRALEPFVKRGINLLKIESRPITGSPWQYRFYLDLKASTAEAATREAIEELRGCAAEVRILGCYPSALSRGPAQHADKQTNSHEEKKP